MSDTPRTDEVASHEGSWDTKALRMTHYARYIERELAEAQNILKQCLSIMPVGYVPTHTVENLPEMIGDLAKALAEETTEREQLERELAEARQQRDTLVEVLSMHGLPYSDDNLEHVAQNPSFYSEIEVLESRRELIRRKALAAVKGGSHE